MGYHALMDFAAMVIGLVVAGVFIGVCSGLLGVGGGTVMVPLLRLAFGLDAYMATATSLFTIIPTSLSGAISHIRNKTCFPKLGVALGLGGAITSTFGVYLGSISPGWAIMVVAAAIILYSAYTMVRKAVALPSRRNVLKRAAKADKDDRRGVSRKSAGDGFAKIADHDALADKDSSMLTPISASADDGFTSAVSFNLTKKTLVAGFAIGMLAGLSAGYVGVGGGFVMVPLMTAWLNVPMKHAPGTSSVAIIILSIPGAIAQCALGHVDYLAGILLAVGSIPGAYLGARLITRVSERELRLTFAGFLGIAAILLIVKEFGLLGS